MTKTETTFEDQLKRLNEIVDTLESDDVTLKGALSAYEESQTLIAQAQEHLVDAEKKVQQLSKQGDVFLLEDFETEA